MQNDNSAWSSDPAWIAEREQKWSIVEAYWDKRNFWGEDFSREEQVEAYRNYYLYGIVDPKHSWWEDLAILHADTSEESIRAQMLAFENRSTQYSLCIDQEDLYELIEAGFLDAGFFDRFFAATTGRTFSEGVELNKLNVDLHMGSYLQRAFKRVFNLYDHANWRRYSPLVVEVVLQHFAEVVTYFTEEQVGTNIYTIYKGVIPDLLELFKDPQTQQDAYLKTIADSATSSLLAEDCPEAIRNLPRDLLATGEKDV